MTVTYTTLTVGRSGGPAFTVGHAPSATLTVLGRSGAIVGLLPDQVFLTESGDYLTLESGDYLAYA